MFLRMCSFQRRDDIDEVVSLAIVHFDLPHPPVRDCFAEHSLCFPKLCLVYVRKADNVRL